MNAPIVFGSNCSGIEAASVALHPLGWRAAWLAEIESFPSDVLAHHYPDTPNLGDMTTIADRVLRGEVVAPDVLIGGTPCQAFSIAGLRKSLDDDRGQLSLALIRQANAIDVVRQRAGKPPVVVWWENVCGVLSTRDNAFGCFLAGLAGEDDPLVPPGGRWKDAGCVFGPQRTVAWRVLDAQYFGLAQRRRRVFVVASAGDGFDPTQVLFEFDGVRRDLAPRREAGQDAAAGTLRGTDGGSDVDHARAGHLVGCFGGGNTSGSIEVAACLTAKGQRLDFEVETFAAMAFHGSQDPDVSGDVTHPLGRNQGQEVCIAFSCKDHGADAGDIAPTLRAMGHGASHANAGGQVAVAVLPFDTTQTTSASNYSNPQPGDPCHPLSAQAHPPAVCITGDIAHTLKAEGFDASEDGTGRGQPIVAVQPAPSSGAYSTKLHNTASNGAGKLYHEYTASLDASSPPPALLTTMAVRRLTPRECERLQGFQFRVSHDTPGAWQDEAGRWWSPDYTAILRKGKPAADGPRYRSLGNSMAVPCMAWIGRRITGQLLARREAAERLAA